MTAEEFRSLALSLPDAVECSHMNHPDFRVGGAIFATLGYPGPEWGMVRLPSEEQARLTQAEPDVFVPVKGAWGRAGNTQVYLHLARKSILREVIKTAWQHRLPKKVMSERVRKVERGGSTLRD